MESGNSEETVSECKTHKLHMVARNVLCHHIFSIDIDRNRIAADDLSDCFANSGDEIRVHYFSSSLEAQLCQHQPQCEDNLCQCAFCTAIWEKHVEGSHD